jgi:hypothetical protein
VTRQLTTVYKLFLENFSSCSACHEIMCLYTVLRFFTALRNSPVSIRLKPYQIRCR